MKKKLCILGSTGSIGINTLKVVEEFASHFSIFAIAAHSNILELEKQIAKFHPRYVVVFDEKKANLLKKNLKSSSLEILSGMEGLCFVASHPDVDFVMGAISGSIGLAPILAAIDAKKTIGLANKEVLVAAGEMVMKKVKDNNISLLPVDSEHNAIFQALQGEEKKNIYNIILTASGGPFFQLSKDKRKEITLNDALSHPTYKMGKKITIDSSTLMNKGLEVIEAYHLFGVKLDQIKVVIHPQSIIHSMVEFCDKSIIAQMSPPDMTLPIQYSLFYPERMLSQKEEFDFTKHNNLSFFSYEKGRFACLDLAFEAARLGKSMPCFLNAANEILVQRFLLGKITWLDIEKKLEKIMFSHNPKEIKAFEDVIDIEKQAKDKALTI